MRASQQLIHHAPGEPYASTCRWRDVWHSDLTQTDGTTICDADVSHGARGFFRGRLVGAVVSAFDACSAMCDGLSYHDHTKMDFAAWSCRGNSSSGD